MEDTDNCPPIENLEATDSERERYRHWCSSMEAEQLRVISYEAAKLASERDVSQVRFVTCMGFDEDRTTLAQLWRVFSVYGKIMRLSMKNRYAEIEYERPFSARQALADNIKFYGRPLLVVYTEEHVMSCPLRSSERPRSNERERLCFVTCTGYDVDRTTTCQLRRAFSVYGQIRRLNKGNRSAEIEYVRASSAREAVAANIKFYGRRLTVEYSD